MSLSQGFPNTFIGQVTNQVTKNLNNETKKIYADINAFMAADGHAHSGNGSDGAKISVKNITSIENMNNLLINSGFIINNGNAGTAYSSGTALTAGQYGHDMVKAGTSGLTYTFTQSTGPVTPITITTGSAILPIDGKRIIGGTYTVSWTGTSQCRVNGGSYGTSPFTITGVAVGTQLNVEFNTGTLSNPKVNEGDKSTPYCTDYYDDVVVECMTYFVVDKCHAYGYAGSAGQSIITQVCFPVQMAAIPTIALGTGSRTNFSSHAASAPTQKSFYFQVNATLSGVAGETNTTYTASARL